MTFSLIRVLLAGLFITAIASASEDSPFIGVDELRRGMSGYALTVVEGTRIDTLQVEVVDVIHGRGSAGDMILVRVSGLGTELSGIAGGMSGSPVYIDGRMAGALAFAWSGARIPLAGVTPIGEMVDVLDRYAAEETQASLKQDYDNLARLNLHEMSGRPRPIATPIAVSGFAPEIAGEIEDFFLEQGMVTTIGGVGDGSGSGSGSGWEPLPGAGVGVRLLSGDANLTAIGTITWVDGERLVAFGHPFFQSGSVTWPLVSVEIHTVMPSRGLSFKIGSPIETVGAMVQDRRTAIAGDLSVEAETIPVTVTVEVPGVRSDQFHYRALKHKSLTPTLAAWATRNSIGHREKLWGDGTIHIRTTYFWDGHEPFDLENVYSSPAAMSEAAGDVAFPIQILGNSPVVRTELEKVDIHVSVLDGRRTAHIESMDIDRADVRPGQTIHGSVMIRHYRGETESIPIELDLPNDLPDGNYLLRVCDAAASEVYDNKRDPNRFSAKTMEGLVAIMKGFRTNDRIYCQLFDSSTGATIDGRSMPRLPGSVLSVFTDGHHSDDGAFSSGAVVASESYSFDFVITGCKVLPITVDRKAH